MRDITQAEFDDFLAETPGLVLVDFWAEWCQPCHILSPVLASLESEFESITFIKVNTDENQDLTQAFAVRSLPTVVLLKPRDPGPGADVVYSSVGVKPRPFWEKVLRDAITPKVGLFQRLKRVFGKAEEPDAAESVDSAKSVDSADSAESVDSVESVDSAEPVDSADSAAKDAD